MSNRVANDIAYENAPHIPGAQGFPDMWKARAAQFRGQFGERAQLDLPYGLAERNRFDLFLPKDTPKGLFVFIHGGYWLAFGRESWSHLAEGAVSEGWAVAIPSYTLAPVARISAMTQEIAEAVRAASRLVAGPVVISGHSAGGHLAARMACEGLNLDVPLARVVPISPLADLTPLLNTSMNDKLQIDQMEAKAESPIHYQKKSTVHSHVWVGAQERPAFLWQARLLSEAWDCPWTAESARHHFDVIDDLAKSSSRLLKVCLAEEM